MSTWLNVPVYQGSGDSTHTIGYICSIAVNVTAVLVNSLFIASVLRKSKLRTVINLWVVHISFIDTVLTLAYMIQTLIDIGRQVPTLWTFGVCQANGFVMQLLVGLTILNLLCVALYQFYVIVLEKPAINVKTACFLMASTWGAVAIIAAAPLFNQTSSYVPHISGWHCAISLINPSTYSLVLALIDIVLFLGTPFILILVYTLILRKIAQTQKEFHPSTISGQMTKEFSMQKIEKKVVQRAIIISSTFIITWFGLGIEWVVTLLRQQSFSWQFEMWISLIVRINPLVNAFICIYLDPKVQESLGQMFGFEPRDSYEYDSTAVHSSKNSVMVFGSHP
ncbi:hypothetical protein EDD86DRAFT_84813 [Gorgonomyces haynaldii]|nr:hypothetical protein EDD86DRAFT_84813 [Gorgonomyces haynaldii]